MQCYDLLQVPIFSWPFGDGTPHFLAEAIHVDLLGVAKAANFGRPVA